jgi:hypothetical protein
LIALNICTTKALTDQRFRFVVVCGRFESLFHKAAEGGGAKIRSLEPARSGWTDVIEVLKTHTFYPCAYVIENSIV